MRRTDTRSRAEGPFRQATRDSTVRPAMTDASSSASRHHLHALVDGFPDRHVGGPGNEHATAYVETELRRQGWDVSEATFDAVDAERGPARLTVAGTDVALLAGPYTLPVDVVAPLVVADSLAALEALDVGGRIVLLHGDIARDQLLPRGFDFLDEPDHRRIYALLEEGGAVGVIGATGSRRRHGWRPVPLPAHRGRRLRHPQCLCHGRDRAPAGRLRRRGGTTCTSSHTASRCGLDSSRPIAARSTPPGRGHGTPRLQGRVPRGGRQCHRACRPACHRAATCPTGDARRLEILPLNGEDHYSVGGEHCFVAANEGRWDEIELAINLDAVGARGAATAVSLYGCPAELAAHVAAVLARHPQITDGRGLV